MTGTVVEERASERAVSVIVPTRALAGRAAVVRRSITSLLAQQDVTVAPIVVINGPDGDDALVRELHSDPRLRVVTLASADLPAALRAGREHVRTPFFAELDDDDELMPDALARRVAILESDASCDVVITNGYRQDRTTQCLHVEDAAAVIRDPLRALARQNWLLPGSWLCRTDRVGAALFDGMPRYLECTYLGLCFAMQYRMRFLDEPTVSWHMDSPLSVSASGDYVLGQVPALERILELDLPADVRQRYREELARACHGIARHYRAAGALRKSWDWHLRSLREPGGWRHIGFTRRLLRPRPRG
jgi:glycosyltransferase involved in cell wall biosynthesis